MGDLLGRLMRWITRLPEPRNRVVERRDLRTRWLHDEEQRQIAEVRERLDLIEQELARSLAAHKNHDR